MGQFAIGQAVPRTEDPRLLRGNGQYVDDVNLPGQAYGYVLRSPHAHARLVSIDIAAAAAAPGVLGVYTGADLADLGKTVCRLPFKRPDGSPLYQAPHPGLVTDRVRHVGDYVAFVVAETIAQAKDAAELIEVHYDPLPAVTDTARAARPGAPLLWEDCANNIATLIRLGDHEAVEKAFAGAHRVVGRRFVINRISANPMEPRGCLAHFDRREGRYILQVTTQAPHELRKLLAEEIFHLPELDFRVMAGDVGGAFGMKGPVYPEYRLCLWSSRRLGRPVKWTCERSEALHSDEHARDNVSDAQLALAEDGTMLALRVKTIANLGAYLSNDRGLIPIVMNLGTLAGVYRTPAIAVEVTGVFSNTNPTAPYRGAGRPEAAYIIESLIDQAAREMGLDRIELRRRNMIPPTAMPFKTGLTFTYDCGEFEKNMDRVLQMIDYDGFEARRAAARERGKLRGLGLSNSIERAAAPAPETVEIRFDPTGGVTILAGTKDQGQGHDLMYKQLLSAKLGLDTDLMRLIDGDTDKVVYGQGTRGSRSAVTGGSALYLAADKVIEKARRIAAHMLEAAPADISFADGVFTIAGTDRSVSLGEAAKTAFMPTALPAGMEPGLYETGTYVPAAMTFPNGCHAVEVEVDRETGKVEILEYRVVDDVGVVINPLIVKGQIRGGIAQGLGQALMEDIVFEEGSGQLLSGSFMDYAMPRADDMCDIAIETNPVPTAANPLGVKGVGEAGTVGALPAILSALADALAPLGVDHIEMPATAERLWRAMCQAPGRQAPGRQAPGG